MSAFISEGREVSTVAAEIKLKIFGIQEEIIRLLNIAIVLVYTYILPNLT